MTDKLVTEESFRIWKSLPKEIRTDPCLHEFNQQISRIYGGVDEDDEVHGNENNGLLNTVQYDKSDSHLIRNVVMAVLFTVWFVSTTFLITVKEKIINHQFIAIECNNSYIYHFSKNTTGETIGIIVEGQYESNRSDTINSHFLSVTVQNSSRVFPWQIPLHGPNDPSMRNYLKKESFIVSKEVDQIVVEIKTNSPAVIALKLGYDPSPVHTNTGAIYAGAILIFLNILIISEVIHRSFAALLAAFIAMGTLAALNDRPTMFEIVNWMDSETLLLIFSMMILVGILMDTGIFDYIAVYVFKISNGKIWPLISTLCIVTVIISAFIDNVTTILLMTPIVVRLCECLNLNPVPMFPIIVLHANIAGLSTLIGHPPNLLITANPYVSESGITFLTYSLHMVIGVVIVLIQTHIQIRLQYGDIDECLMTGKADIHSKISMKLALWMNACNALPSCDNNHTPLQGALMSNLQKLKDEVKLQSMPLKGLCIAPELVTETLERLKNEYPIKNRLLLVKTGVVLGLVVVMFFVESVPQFQRLSLGWCAFIGVLLILIISNQNLDILMQRIEWTTLMFFGSMFITMECLARLGLITWIGQQTENLILCANRDAQLAVAILIILWISAFTSSVVDSVPVTAMMIKVVVALAQNENLSLPVQPLVWALAFGPTMGGNGTLYGASANIVCAGVAEKLGHKITFYQYFKVAFPVMLGNVLLTTAYLMIAHVLFQWH